MGLILFLAGGKLPSDWISQETHASAKDAEGEEDVEAAKQGLGENVIDFEDIIKGPASESIDKTAHGQD